MKRLISTTTAIALVFASVPTYPIYAQTADSACVTGTEAACTDKKAKKAAKKAAKEATQGTGTLDTQQQTLPQGLAPKPKKEKAAKAAPVEAPTAPLILAEPPAPKPKKEKVAPAEAPAVVEAPAQGSTLPQGLTPKPKKNKVVTAPETVAPQTVAPETVAPTLEPQVVTPAPEPQVPALLKPKPRKDKTAEAPAAETPAVIAPPPAEAPPALVEAPAKPLTAAEAAQPLPVPAPEAVQSLDTLLANPERGTAETRAPLAAALAGGGKTRDKTKDNGKDKSKPAPITGDPVIEPIPLATTDTRVTRDDRRSSSDEFRAGPKFDKDGRRDKKAGLTDLEKVGLLALGAVAVGMIINNNRVVANTGDRVIVSRSDGTYRVLKDDDTLLRQPGNDVRTETFRDGSTRTTYTRADGSQIVTIRDASGRVLQRVSVDRYGNERVLIDDLADATPIDVTTLPRHTRPITVSASNGNPDLALALATANATQLGRTFSLQQVRDIQQVRALAPEIEVTPIQFATGSSAIDPAEAEKLAALGKFISDVIADHPNEMFLVEGHTDSVGSAASNLALSDRRAESLALALTEYFGVPPENLVVQGYGESDLLIPVEGDEPQNRRVAVRMISSLLSASAE